MNEDTRNRLEVKLRKMLASLEQTESREERPKPRSGIGNVIRRRAGEKDKRFLSALDPYCIPQQRDSEA